MTAALPKKPFNHMDPGEIIREYNAAKDKTKQVAVLADLNCCTKKDMARWLHDQGCKVDGRLFGWYKAIDKVFANAGTPEERAEMEKAKRDEHVSTKPVCQVKDQTVKRDAGKPKLSLVPVQIIYDIAAVREYGNKKYPDGGRDNWKQVETERYRDAAFRHFLQYIQDPGSLDEESGLPHLWHWLCNGAFLAELEKERFNDIRRNSH